MKDIALIITRTFGVEIDESYLCRMFNEAVGGQGIPHYVSIDEIKTVPHAPVSHPFVERLIGTTRRAFLDHVLFWNALDLQRRLADFRAY